MTVTDSPDPVSHELDTPPWRRVESTIISAANDIRALYDSRYAELDLTLSLAMLLCYLADFGPVSQSHAADHLRQGRAVTGTQVDKLEARGLVERIADPGDRRVWLVQLTADGKELAAQAIEIDVVVRRQLRAGIPREDRHTLANLLLTLQSNIANATNPSHES